MSHFSGSYRAADATFLLKPIVADFVDLGTKEELIQSGRRHYSEMISFEPAPSDEYTRLFRDLTARHKYRLAGEIMGLARVIADSRADPLSLISLARAGTPVGALLARALRRLGRTETKHYSISIIRDRGIDTNALESILRRDQRPAEGLVFVDGWTGKGVITRELQRAVKAWNATHLEQLDGRLYVVADIGGVADVAATLDDYVIPSGIMNATVSGLVSRSILNGAIGRGDYHGCVYYSHLEPYDLSNWFLDTITETFDRVAATPFPSHRARARRHAEARAFLHHVGATWEVDDANHVKPGSAEATRAMLRRVPELLLLKDADNPDVAHLCFLAQERDIAVRTVPDMPFAATALIKRVKGKKINNSNAKQKGV